MVSTKRRAGRMTLEKRVMEFRSLVFRGVQMAVEHGYDLRPYEGALSLHWPPFFHLRSTSSRYTLHLSCSVLGGEVNHYSWKGRTWGEAFRKATEDVEFWISQIGESQDVRE